MVGSLRLHANHSVNRIQDTSFIHTAILLLNSRVAMLYNLIRNTKPLSVGLVVMLSHEFQYGTTETSINSAIFYR